MSATRYVEPATRPQWERASREGRQYRVITLDCRSKPHLIQDGDELLIAPSLAESATYFPLPFAVGKFDVISRCKLWRGTVEIEQLGEHRAVVFFQAEGPHA